MSSKLLAGAAITACCSLMVGCNLVAATGLATDYSFDAIEYASPQFGSTTTGTVPDVPCMPTDDACATASTALAQPNVTLSCDTSLGKCIATAEIRASETIDISKQTETSFPSQAIQFGVQAVEVKRVTYWVNMNALNVATPVIDFFVAPTAAHDETDPAATLLTSIAAIPAMSNVCGDPAYTPGDTKAVLGTPVCQAPLPSAGKNALAGFVKDYKTPFQIIAHSIIVARPGDPIPSGELEFAARPTVGLKILD